MICKSEEITIEFVNKCHNTKATITSIDGKTVTCDQFDRAKEKLCNLNDCGCTYTTTIGNEPVILAPDLRDENIYNIIYMSGARKMSRSAGRR